jgi:serine/threonine protein kinase
MLLILQVENLLISSKNVIKLCDFGSATTKAYYPDHNWSAVQRSLTEDEVCYLLLLKCSRSPFKLITDCQEHNSHVPGP